MYLQRGLRWIPGYKVALDGKGNAVIKLEATLINELADMEDVTAQLVVGVPTFAFKDLIDPISLQQVMARLSPYFDQNAISASRLSNALMSQTAAPAINEGREESGVRRPRTSGRKLRARRGMRTCLSTLSSM